VRRAAAGWAVALALAGCGGDAGDDVRGVVAGWLSALSRSDGEAACALVATELAARASPSCEAVYGGYGELLGERLGQAGLTVAEVVAAEPDAVAIRVDGTRARASILGAPFQPIELRRTADGWRIVRGLVPA
jgi:hypothetical protein